MRKTAILSFFVFVATLANAEVVSVPELWRPSAAVNQFLSQLGAGSLCLRAFDDGDIYWVNASNGACSDTSPDADADFSVYPSGDKDVLRIIETQRWVGNDEANYAQYVANGFMIWVPLSADYIRRFESKTGLSIDALEKIAEKYGYLIGRVGGANHYSLLVGTYEKRAETRTVSRKAGAGLSGGVGPILRATPWRVMERVNHWGGNVSHSNRSALGELVANVDLRRRISKRNTYFAQFKILEKIADFFSGILAGAKAYASGPSAGDAPPSGPGGAISGHGGTFEWYWTNNEYRWQGSEQVSPGGFLTIGDLCSNTGSNILNYQNLFDPKLLAPFNKVCRLNVSNGNITGLEPLIPN